MSKEKTTLWQKIYSPMILALAVRNLKLNKFRTILSMIGIVIGVFAICGMGMISAGFTVEMNSMISDTADTLTITPIGEKVIDGTTTTGFSTKDLRDIESAVRSVTKDYDFIPMYSSMKYIYIGKETTAATISGMASSDIDTVANIIQGTLPRGSTNVVVGEKFAKDNDLRIGSRIVMLDKAGKEVTCRVVGIMENTGMVSLGFSTDNAVVGSVEWYTGLVGDNHGLYNKLIVRAYYPAELTPIDAAIEKRMNGKEDKDSDNTVSILNSYEIMGTFDDIMAMSSIFTTIISGISLLVAAVAITNVMLMSVKERTREVGILRSIGTYRSQILQMFLYEAGLIGLIGAIIGTLLALIAAPIMLMAMIGTLDAMLSPTVLIYVPVGILIGLIVCLLSGLYPAWSAANLNPVEAMSTD
ncbi:MAG TPA: ABC transporter permease [Methanocorpusculum sp.]|nr:ABC transporter permease [Methanocorpusculum sp.]